MKQASISFICVVATAAFCAACTSYKLDVGTICDAARLADLAGEKNPKKQLVTQLEWARRNVHSSEGSALLAKVEGCSLGGVANGEHCKDWRVASGQLRAESVKVGRKECALADWMDKAQQAIIDQPSLVR